MDKINLIRTIREGSTRTFVVEALTDEQRQAAIAKFGESRVGMMGSSEPGVMVIRAGNKFQAATVEKFIAASGIAPVDPTAQRSGNVGARYIERLAIAERDGLNHGKAWTCSGMQADRDSLPPEFEGELVCYVYPA